MELDKNMYNSQKVSLLAFIRELIPKSVVENIENFLSNKFEGGVIKGCTDSDFQEYRSKYTEDTDPTSCKKKHIVGCTDKRYEEYDRKFTKNRKSDCKTKIIVKGCMNSDYQEYDRHATKDDGSCKKKHKIGCMDSKYKEYKKKFTKNKQSDCKTKIVKSEIKGCTDPLATNYNSDATKDDGSCIITKIENCTFTHSAYNTNSLIKDERFLRQKLQKEKEGEINLTTAELNNIKSDLDYICKKVTIMKAELENGCKCNRKVGKLSVLKKSDCY